MLTHCCSAIILNNWLVNTTGREDSFLPVDLLQEHMNLWIKVLFSTPYLHPADTDIAIQTIYQAQGSGASWEWLETISPCVNVLRDLASQINNSLGAHQGAKHHAPDLTNDIQEIMKALRTHRVYQQEDGHIIDDSAEVPDVLVNGLHSLAGPLRDYNTAFKRLRNRRKTQPLVGAEFIMASQLTDLTVRCGSHPLGALGGGDVLPNTIQKVQGSKTTGRILEESGGELNDEYTSSEDDEGEFRVTYEEEERVNDDEGEDPYWGDNITPFETVFLFETTEDVQLDI